MYDLLKDAMKILLMFIFGFILAATFLTVILYFFVHVIPHIYLFDNKKSQIDANILRVQAASVIILTIMLICVGWLQLNRLNRTSNADFLLRIDNRYGSLEIIKARAIIQKLFREAYPIGKALSEEIYIKKMSVGIEKIRRGKDEKSCDEYMHLLNFLEFLETLAYFSRKDFISVKEVNELLGNSLVFYYKVYKCLIYDRRMKYDNRSYYCELEALVDKIESSQAKDKLSKECFFIRLFH